MPKTGVEPATFALRMMMVGLAMAYPSATTIVSNRASVDQQGEILGVYQSIGAAALGLSPVLVGFAVGAHPTLAAWGGAFSLILSSFFFWLERSNIKSKTLHLASD